MPEAIYETCQGVVSEIEGEAGAYLSVTCARSLAPGRSTQPARGENIANVSGLGVMELETTPRAQIIPRACPDNSGFGG